MINVVAIIFRYLNFFVLVSLFKYAFSAYIIPSVRKMMQDIVLYLKKLQQDTQDVQKNVEVIQQQMKNQQIFFDEMRHKFVLWRKKCEVLREQEQKKEKKYIDSMHERCATRLVYIQNDRALQKQLPAILDSVTTQLETKYTVEQVGQKYIDELLRAMKDIS